MTAYGIAATYLRYATASVAALAVDMLVFLAVLQSGSAATRASAVGYMVGILAHWMLSSRFVFGNLAARGPARLRQKGLFVGSALVGLLLTVAIVGLGEAAGVPPILAKGAAIIVSFQATYLLRKTIVFAA
jgi:putative flippase GtrA